MMTNVPQQSPTLPEGSQDGAYALWDERDGYVRIGNRRMQYVMQVTKNGGGGLTSSSQQEEKVLRHVHWGVPLPSLHRLPTGLPANGGDEYTATYQEFACAGGPDDREPSCALRRIGTTGDPAFRFAYESHKILSGKPPIPGLPSTYAESDDEAVTVLVTLVDRVTSVRIRLYYTAFRDYDAIARHVQVENCGDENVQVRKLSSWCFDLPPPQREEGYHALQLPSAWARECQETWNPVEFGTYIVSDAQGSKTQRTNPFLALADGPPGREETGTVMGFSHVYTGAFRGAVQRTALGYTRVVMGLHPDLFEWLLEPGESFHAPEVIGVYSDAGLGGMSRTFHRLYRERLARGAWRDQVRPILLNTWEATSFHFTEASLLELARSAQGTGVELFVLDDGWFGRRDDDRSSLGDWTPDLAKLPNGIKGLADRINRLGFRFGLWVEPEMVSRDSDLYRRRPDWAIEAPGRHAPEMRHQLMLDLTNPEVQDYVVDAMSALFASADIAYVKWDHNRYIAGPYGKVLPANRQGEFVHRYILALYRIVDTLTRRFPSILFENCASGGGRFDPGMLAYMPQTWASDDTDAEERVKIQWGLSYVYPLSSVGAHVASVPNHQVRRTTPWDTRAAVAHFGAFGYELDMRKLSDNEIAAAALSSHNHKTIRHIVYFGDFYRLRNPFKSNWPAWMSVLSDQSEAAVLLYQRLNHTRMNFPTVALRGLDPEGRYRVKLLTSSEDGTNVNLSNGALDGAFSGAELMSRGLAVQFVQDFEALTLHVSRDETPRDI